MAEDSFERWKRDMRVAIGASTIAIMCREWVRDGRGGVTPEAMRSFAKEAGAVVDLWEEAVVNGPRS
jgi:hypothetical protein